MATIKIVFPTPTDNISDSADLDILIYNGALGSEVLFETILKDDIRKSIVGSNIEITGVAVSSGTTYNFSAKARDEAGNLSVAFSPITVHAVPAAAYVMLDNVNTTLSASITYVAGTPNQFQATANTQYLKYNTAKTGAFSMKMFIKDAYTKSIGFGLDDANNNTGLQTTWEAFVCIVESYAIKLDTGGTINPNVPTTVTPATGNYIRMSRASAVSSILVHYYNGTTEVLVHTFAPASGSTWLKALMPYSNRRIYDLQVQ